MDTMGDAFAEPEGTEEEEMTEGMRVDAGAIARRCSLQSPSYRALTSLDWVVLDFTDGLRTFDEMCTQLAVNESELAASYLHLRELGFLTWQDAESQASDTRMWSPGESRLSGARALNENAPSSASASRSSSVLFGSQLGNRPVALMPSTKDFDDGVCRQYIPARMIPQFRQFMPSLVDAKLDIPVEVQVFAEFIYENLSSMSPYDLLCLEEGDADRNQIRRAYQLKTKQFHPDRYFRKNIGSFAPRIAAISKAVSTAYTRLQSK